MANTLGIPEVTLAQARDISHAINGVGAGGRSRWNQSLPVRVTDHADNDTGETGEDTEKMAIFISSSLHMPWIQAGARRGHQVVSAGKDQDTDPRLFPV